MTWMRDNNTLKWSKGLRFIQVMKNRANHKNIKRSPYEALFGCKMKVGLETLFLPADILKDLNNEESLLKFVDRNSIGPTNQEISTRNDEDIITTINEDIYIADNIKNKGHCLEENKVKFLCKLCNRTKKTQRKEEHCNLEIQAIKMKAKSNKKFPPALVGNTVRVPISDVDRGRGEAHNVLACVLKQLYARSQFTVCQQNFVSLEEVNHEKQLCLRSIATQEATGSGQGFIKCSCSTRCQNNRLL
ncbi:hypothetical protein QTP88_024835 [Uroleucon formosanum]